MVKFFETFEEARMYRNIMNGGGAWWITTHLAG